MKLDENNPRPADSPEPGETAPEPDDASRAIHSASAEGGATALEAPGSPLRSVAEDLRVPWSWSDLLVFVLACLAGAIFLVIVLAIATSVLGIRPSGTQKALTESNIVGVVLQIVFDVCVIAYLAAQMRLRFGSPFWHTIGWRPFETGGVSRGMAYVGLVFAGFLLDVVVTLASAISPPKRTLPIETLFRDRRTALLFILMAVVVAPAIEETIFRGYIYPVLARSWGIAAGVIVTGLLFGGLHAPQLWGGPWQIAALVFVGIVLTFARASTRTVVASFVIHTSYNSFQALALLIGTHGLRHLPSIH